MIRWLFLSSVPFLIFCICLPLEAQISAAQKTNSVQIFSVDVSGNTVPLSRDGKVNLGAFPNNIVFHYGPNTNVRRAPIRLEDKMDGQDDSWHVGISEMYLTIRFYDAAHTLAGQTIFKVRGSSTGWTGSFASSQLTHRQETVTVPNGASLMMIVISSAGPPASKGVYAVANLTASKLSSDQPPLVLLRSPLDQQPFGDFSSQNPPGWLRDGMSTTMAKVVSIGSNSVTKAFAIIDDDSTTHGEWHNTFASAPKVAAGEKLVIEWNEMYCIGDGSVRWDRYDTLKPGKYRFRVREVDVFGLPTQVEDSLEVLVTIPFWETPWFWSIALVGLISVTYGTGRYLSWHRMRREIARLQSQKALEQERLRIARDIHDDLGARVTEISLLSAMSLDDPTLSDTARANFTQISQMSRKMVSALYETVWAVNPAKDNLDALGDYLCQIVNQLCGNAQLPCCIHMKDLPHEVQISSQARHTVSMVVKEAVHNAVKHARASKLNLHIQFEAHLLTITVQDNGCGLQPEVKDGMAGNGLNNMKRRMTEIGGKCEFEGQAGQGTSVHISLPLDCSEKT